MSPTAHSDSMPSKRTFMVRPSSPSHVQFCGLAYDQDAIQSFIEKNVPASDMDFSAELSTMTGGTKYENENMTESEKTARCTQVKRVAKSYGFIR